METHKRRTSKLSLEPNPFERSFSLAHTDESNSARRSAGNANSTKSITLPPVTAINSPLGHEGTSAVWGRDSLRSGPLSPAMLGGPAAPTARPRMTPRLGLTDPTLHTGLTPFLQGEAHPTVGSILGSSTIDGSKPSPGFQALLKAVSGSEITSTPGGTLHVKPLQNTSTMQQKSPRPMGVVGARNLQSMPLAQVNVTSTTSDVLKNDVIGIKAPSPPAISLSTIPESQQPLPEPKETAAGHPAQPSGLAPKVANVPMELSSKNIAQASPSISGKRRIKDLEAPQAVTPPSAAVPAAPTTPLKTPPKTAKRSRGKAPKVPVQPKEPIPATAAAPNVDGARKAARRSESADPKSGGDDEKRRQFLERNRVAALKCRQRKKQQLNELQRRHDYMIYENERLKNEYLQLRDKALHIKTLLEAHRECSVAQANGVFGIDSLPPGTPNISSQPIVFALPDGVQSEKLKEIISAIPPTSNGVPINGVDTVSGRPYMMTMQHGQQQQHGMPPPPPGAIVQGVPASLVARSERPGFRPSMGQVGPPMMTPPNVTVGMAGMMGQLPPPHNLGRQMSVPPKSGMSPLLPPPQQQQQQQRILHFAQHPQPQTVASAAQLVPIPSSSA